MSWRIFNLFQRTTAVTRQPQSFCFAAQTRGAEIRSHTTNAEDKEQPQNNAQAQNVHNETIRELEHHAQFAKTWWDINGPMKGLHAMNEIRVPFIRDGLIARGQIDAKVLGTPKVLQQQKILEVGCGGGILTEQLARLGANVTGIDLGPELIQSAQEHVEKFSSNIKDRIEYKVQSIESHAHEKTNYYDAVVLSEVIEHIDEKAKFLAACVQALKPGGSIFITTLNKTIALWICGILISENVLNIVPKGTHQWDKLISPLDLERLLNTLNCHTVLINGSTYDFWSNRWRWVDSTILCYALQAIKAETI